MEVPNAAIKKMKEVVVDIEKEYGFWFNQRNSIKAIIDFPITCESEWSWFIYLICKSIIDDSLRW